MPKQVKKQGDQKEVEVAEWTNQQITSEINRLKSLGSSCIPVKVKNISFLQINVCFAFTAQTAIIREDNVFVNRVECDTAFDFNRIERILISDPVPCPVKPGFNFVYVILFCNNIPLIMPYLYNSSYLSEGHDLKQWLFINNKLVSSRQVVDMFETV